ncbi:MAG: hypothetical protein RIG77_15045 [Cyclobacteriaceae bacterium]
MSIRIIISLFCVIYLPLRGFGQACPACSNPAMQSSERLAASLDTLHLGDFSMGINVTNGFNYEGGHPNAVGLSKEGNLVQVPSHDHQVSLDYARIEVNLEYTFATNWTGWLRIPYDFKFQDASINYRNPADLEKSDLIIRNRDIHHRNESYRGPGDIRLLVSRRLNQFLSKNGRLDIAVGTSLPSGKTENDPLAAGLMGQPHLHIQFGTGTFDPLFELHYKTQLAPKWPVVMYSINKISIYTNHKGYRGPFETTAGLSLGHQLKPWLSIRGSVSNFTQTKSYWNGVADPNSGLFAVNSDVGVTIRKNKLFIAPSYRFPLHQRTLSSSGDTFKYGNTFLLNISTSF